MASRGKRGLPENFDINIPEPDASKPVQLGDYLEEVDVSTPRPPRPAPRQQGESNVIEMPRTSERHDEPAPAAPEEEEEEEEKKKKADEAKQSRRHRRKRVGPTRKQINATPETLRMMDEIIAYVQTYSVQKDAKASEVFHALVLALYEARESIDLSEVQARGRWGQPTAKAFPISLKNAFQEAIASEYRNHL